MGLGDRVPGARGGDYVRRALIRLSLRFGDWACDLRPEWLACALVDCADWCYAQLAPEEEK